jgi:polynucleotide 5'-hydroxyl-kinase GRC3/NOL9
MHMRCSIPAVAYLETDIGQSEFTPPGFVSLVIVSSPLFGPPFTHLTHPTYAYFVGEVTPKSAISLYLHSVFKAYEDYLEHFGTELPLVVNTHGWVKGSNSFHHSVLFTSVIHYSLIKVLI